MTSLFKETGDSTGASPNTPQRTPLTIADELDKLRDDTTAEISARNNSYNIMLLGDSGIGKTSILDTAKRPVLVHSFDPGGSSLAHLKPLINSGEYIYDGRYEREDASNPTAFQDWDREFERLRKAGVFNEVGTYVIDSFTTWLASAKNEIIRRKAGGNVSNMKMKGKAWEGILELQDWNLLGQLFINMTKLCTALPCDFILTGHLHLTKDEVSGKLLARFKSIPSLQVDIPLLFDEIYVMDAMDTPSGAVRSLITQTTGKYIARTRMGSGIFDVKEKPDLGYLKEKAEKGLS